MGVLNFVCVTIFAFNRFHLCYCGCVVLYLCQAMKLLDHVVALSPPMNPTPNRGPNDNRNTPVQQPVAAVDEPGDTRADLATPRLPLRSPSSATAYSWK